MNRSVIDVGGAVLVVSQFTLAADTSQRQAAEFRRRRRRRIRRARCTRYSSSGSGNDVGRVETGRFGADMQVALVNDGPVTFLLS